MRHLTTPRDHRPSPWRPFTGRRRWPLAAAVLTSALVTAGCGGSPGPAAGTSAPAVTTTAPAVTATAATTAATTTTTGAATTAAPAAVWTAMARSPLPRLLMVTGAWDGRELLVVGAASNANGSGGMSGAAAAYTPATDRWRTLPAPSIPTEQGAPASVWTGRELFVWGGGFHHALDPATGRWRELSGIQGAAYGVDFALVWTGRLVLGWGGGCCGGNVGTGAAYDPVADRWTALPPAPLSARHTAGVWTGSELLIAGGWADDGPVFADAAAYNPTTHRWRRLPPMPAPRAGATLTWTGDRLLVAGGYTELPTTRPVVADLAVYTPASNAWRVVTGPQPGRVHHGAVWTGHQLLLWGGTVTFGGAPAPHGLAYTPATGRWTALPLSSLRGREDPVVAWTGRQLLVWGGWNAGDGARFTP
jgi:Kelch motif